MPPSAASSTQIFDAARYAQAQRDRREAHRKALSEDLEKLKDAIRANTYRIAEALLGPATYSGRDESRWRENQSLSIRLSTATYYDFAGGDHGDLIALVQQEMRYSFPKALEWIRDILNQPAPEHTTPMGHQARKLKKHKKTTTAMARYRFSLGIPIPDTSAEQYLADRGIELSLLHPAARRLIDKGFTLRFLPDACHPGIPGTSALLVAARDLTAPGYPIVGIQMTWLRNGIKLSQRPNRIDIGPLPPVAKIWMGGETANICTGEGLENTLSIAVATPEWSAMPTLSSSRLPNWDAPPKCRRLLIAADNDIPSLKVSEAKRKNTGLVAARHCADLNTSLPWLRISCPPVPDEDHNDLLQKHGRRWLAEFIDHITNDPHYQHPAAQGYQPRINEPETLLSSSHRT